MKTIRMLVVIMVIFIVIYMILKYIAVVQEKKQACMRERVITPREIKIVSRDLYVKSENLLALSDVYELQLVQIGHDIDNIESMIDEERRSCIQNTNDIKSLIDKSLKLQERKCILESKILKINKELNDLALEEYRRQMV